MVGLKKHWKLAAGVATLAGLGVALPAVQLQAANDSSHGGGTITGKILTANGNPVAHAVVRCMGSKHRGGMFGPGRHRHGQGNSSGTQWSTIHIGTTHTGSDGTFTFSNAPAGYYRIRGFARGKGMVFMRHPIHVHGTHSVDVGTLTLKQWHHGHHGPKHHGKKH